MKNWSRTMTSEKQKEAHRKNAKKSTGPISLKGKSIIRNLVDN